MFWFYKKILSLLFPSQCFGCQKPGQAICISCIATLQKAKPIQSSQDFALFAYNQPIVRAAIVQLKYFKRAELAELLVISSHEHIRTTIETIRNSTSATKITLIPIPLSNTRLNERGFNQSALLCEWFSIAISTSSTDSSLLFKQKHTAPQALTKDKSSRLQNVSDTMSARYLCNPDSIYIIVDDVHTTGATIAEAKRALAKAGARHLYSITLAHG